MSLYTAVLLHLPFALNHFGFCHQWHPSWWIYGIFPRFHHTWPLRACNSAGCSFPLETLWFPRYKPLGFSSTVLAPPCLLQRLIVDIPRLQSWAPLLFLLHILSPGNLIHTSASNTINIGQWYLNLYLYPGPLSAELQAGRGLDGHIHGLYSSSSFHFLSPPDLEVRPSPHGIRFHRFTPSFLRR